jgi:organic hydroperoxide reductase OsmC/OhrA
VARFAPLYDVALFGAEAEVRFAIDRRDKLGLDGPGGAARWVTVDLRLDSPAAADAASRLAAHAERACHAARSLAAAVPVRLSVRLNGAEIAPSAT